MIETGSYGWVTFAFVIGGVVMAIGGIVEILLGVSAERRSLEAVARPINAVRQHAATGSRPPTTKRACMNSATEPAYAEPSEMQ